MSFGYLLLNYRYLLIMLLFSTSAFSADKSILINSLQNNNENNYSNTQIYIKTNSDKYFIKQKLQSAGLGNIKSISKPFEKQLKNNIKLQSSERLQNIYLIEFDAKTNIIEICLSLNERQDIEYASPVYHRELFEYIPNDYDEQKQFYLKQINAFEAFEISKGDTSVVVGVIDSGIDILHEDLKDNIFVNYAEKRDDGIDNDNNGFTDDYIGWDFVGDINAEEIEMGLFKENNNVIPSKSISTHGTHVAGLVSAVTDNETGIASIGYKVKLLPIKCTVDDLRISSKVYRTNEAMLYALLMGVDIINCSWGSGDSYDPVEHEVIKTLYDNNILIVASAGNSSKDITGAVYPADYPEVLTVGAINLANRRTYFTCFGPNVDVYAPGEDIYSTDDNNNYSQKSGTSMSSPIVAGLAALIKSANPHMNAEEIKYQIKASSPKHNSNTDKLLNAGVALKYNNPEYPDFTLPGLKLKNITINENDSVITDFSNRINYEYENVLSDVDLIKASPFSDKFNFKITFPVESNNGNFNFSADFTVDDDFPYFRGITDIGVELSKFIDEDITYFDYDEVRFPYNFSTNNRFMNMADINALYTFWQDCHITDNMTFWGVVFINNIKYLTRFGDSLSLILLEQNYANQFQALNDNFAFYQSKPKDNEDKLALYKVHYNNSDDFEVNNITEIPLPKHHRFHMFTEDYGILVNYYDKLQILEYKNNNIVELNNLPIELENISIRDILLFTHINRVGIYITEKGNNKMHYIYSDDMMNSWEYVLNEYPYPIENFAFSDDSTGMATSGYKYFYVTEDFGSSWELTEKEINTFHSPNLIYSPYNSNEFIFVYTDNVIKSTTDYGNNWRNIKNQDKGFDGSLNAGRASCAGTFGNKVRVFNMFNHIEYLEYDLIPKAPTYSYELQSNKNINLDTVLIGESKSSYIMIKNTGNALLSVDSLYFVNDYESVYTFRDDKIDFISAGKSGAMFFDFTPIYSGNHDTQIVVKFKETGDSIVIELKAEADYPSSVREISKQISLFPNPVSDYLEISNNTDYLINYIMITDVNGRKVYESGEANRIKVSELSNGTYFITVNINNSQIHRKFIKK